MAARFSIHPAIGVARLGNSTTSIAIASEREGALPIDCDPDGNPVLVDGHEQPVKSFKDDEGRIRRQAARFRVFVTDRASPEGRELAIGDVVTVEDPHTGQKKTIRVDDVAWTVYLANKKASWYAFQETAGEHGYGAGHPLRNAAITDPGERQRLIIDPGPRTVSFAKPKARRATFSSVGAPSSFPPPDLAPEAVTSLGDLIATRTGDHARLLVLGGYGRSGSMLRGFGQPRIQTYANNDGWFDDTSDGPVAAQVIGTVLEVDGRPPAPPVDGGPPRPFAAAVGEAAWAMVGYPRYAPEIVDLITMDELVFDVGVRSFALAPYMYGPPDYDGAVGPPADDAGWAAWRRSAGWNAGYRPYFWRDVWPILLRPNDYGLLMDRDAFAGGNPHSTDPRGNFDPAELSVAPYEGEDPGDRERRAQLRGFLYRVLHQPGQENQLLTPDLLLRMPLLCGDNPISNTVPSKFLRLTDTMLFVLRQWAEGCFIDERREGFDPGPQLKGPGAALDRGALASALGGAFCPGGEASWIMRNPAIYAKPYRIHAAGAPQPGALSQPGVVQPDVAADLAAGLEPGDLTKYGAVPWQSDFNECSTQDVDVTYEGWNAIDPSSTGDPRASRSYTTYWWPSHRPMFVANIGPWSPTAQNDAGDLQMVSVWWRLGFLLKTQDPNNPVKVVEASAGAGA